MHSQSFYTISERERAVVEVEVEKIKTMKKRVNKKRMTKKR